MGLAEALIDPMDRSATLIDGYRRALEAAERFVGATAPNPPVGCTILDAEGHVLAVAAHRGAGHLHAEAMAIAQCREAGTVSRIDTILVTLEPCNHTGRTPPCVEAILSTPARAVIVGSRDPNPTVPGLGLERLRAAGLSVQMLAELGTPQAHRLALASERLIAPFASRSVRGRPWVTVKQALDAAGGMIPPMGRKTFTSPEALLLAHKLRKRADAILTGSGTILADDPHFTVRHVPDHAGKRRTLYILDRRRRVPQSYVEAATARGFIVRIVDELEATLAQAAADGANEVLVEAGPTLTRSVLDRGLWDQHVKIQQHQPADIITVRHADPRFTQEDDHVFRHH
jgi:diaminohydroxyphosphoribosylaminopyrimidine deaminase/5-amino-6-(5-phosphoribosylamino)uracil reductase